MEPIYQINENATYETEIRALQDTDPALATKTFNPLFKTMINNTHAVKKEVEAIADKVKAVSLPQITVTNWNNFLNDLAASGAWQVCASASALNAPPDSENTGYQGLFIRSDKASGSVIVWNIKTGSTWSRTIIDEGSAFSWNNWIRIDNIELEERLEALEGNVNNFDTITDFDTYVPSVSVGMIPVFVQGDAANSPDKFQTNLVGFYVSAASRGNGFLQVSAIGSDGRNPVCYLRQHSVGQWRNWVQLDNTKLEARVKTLESSNGNFEITFGEDTTSVNGYFHISRFHYTITSTPDAYIVNITCVVHTVNPLSSGSLAPVCGNNKLPTTKYSHPIPITFSVSDYTQISGRFNNNGTLEIYNYPILSSGLVLTTSFSYVVKKEE